MIFMKRLVLLCLMVFFSFAEARGCTNFPINVGVIDSVEGQIFAKIISTIIKERTGLRVGRKYFKSTTELYEAVDQKKIEILVENTTNAMRFVNKPVAHDPEKDFETVKIIYKKDKGLIWLKPFGFITRMVGMGRP